MDHRQNLIVEIQVHCKVGQSKYKLLENDSSPVHDQSV